MLNKLRKGQVVTGKTPDGQSSKWKVAQIEYRNASTEYDEFFEAVSNDKFLSLFGIVESNDYHMSEHLSQKGDITLVKIIKPKQYAKCYSNPIFNISFTPFRDGIEIFRLEVKPEHQGQGIGTALLQRFNMVSAKLDIPIYLKPGDLINGNNVDQEKRIRFYANEGFEKPKGDKYYNNLRWLDDYYNGPQEFRDKLDAIHAKKDKIWEKY